LLSFIVYFSYISIFVYFYMKTAFLYFIGIIIIETSKLIVDIIKKTIFFDIFIGLSK